MTLTEAKVRGIIESGTPAGLYENKRVLVLTPDGTRTCPLPMMVRILGEMIGARAAKLDFMVALGTHPVMTERQILELYKISPEDRVEPFGRSAFFCHRWDLPETFRRIGELTEKEVATISGGLLREPGEGGRPLCGPCRGDPLPPGGRGMISKKGKIKWAKRTSA